MAVWAASRAEAPGAAIVVAVVAFLLLILVVVLYQWRCLGMTSVAAVDIVVVARRKARGEPG